MQVRNQMRELTLLVAVGKRALVRALFVFTFLVSLNVVAPALVLAQGLSFDSDHDVLTIPTCEVAVRYNNKTFVPVKATTNQVENGLYLARPVQKSIRLVEDFSGVSVSQSPEQIFVECYEAAKIGPLGTSRFSKDFLKDNKMREVTVTSDRVAKETGLPVTAVTSLKSVKCYEVTPKSGGTVYNLFALQHGEFLTMFARQMRSGTDFRNDPPQIVAEMRFGKTEDSRSNVKL